MVYEEKVDNSINSTIMVCSNVFSYLQARYRLVAA